MGQTYSSQLRVFRVLTCCSSHCNLLKGHTEHQSFPWSRQELAKSAIRSMQLRCQMRINHAAEQEINIREFMAEVVFRLNSTFFA